MRRKTCLTCKENRNKNKCEHGRVKNMCKDCGGKSICEHGRAKSYCKECKGSQICEHGRNKGVCKDCGGSQICEHGRQKCYCKDCGGSQICKHGIVKGVCQFCKGSQICEHNTLRTRCMKCDPLGYIKHIINLWPKEHLGELKSKSGMKYLGCTSDELKTYLEELLTEGLTWDNFYTHWHVRMKEIPPIKLVNDTIQEADQEIKNRNIECLNRYFHYTNLKIMRTRREL